MSTILSTLRSVVPMRPLSRGEAMRVAELQANKLLEMVRITAPPVWDAAIADIPRIQVERLSSIPVSGSVHWAKGHWIIALNETEPLVRQRFSLAHEFKHVLDSPFATYLYLDERGVTSAEHGEQAADYFAGCLLVPRMWVKRTWASGLQALPALSRRFGVSQAAMQVRLIQTGLIDSPTHRPSSASQGRR